jgi:hypothetical protein
MPFDVAAIAFAAAKAVASALASRLAGAALPQERVSRWLGRDPPRLALWSAMQDSLTAVAARHPAAAEAFFDEVFLTTKPVATLLARCVPPWPRPEPAELAGLYVDHLGPTPDRPTALRQMTPLAADFLETFREQLHHKEPFRPFFDSADVGSMERSLAALLDDLPNLLARLDHAPERLRSHIKSMATIRDRHTALFVGREFVMNELDQRLTTMTGGYLLIKGQPGIGKSAVMAELVRTRDYVHHFNVATAGIRSADQFLRNVCAQLIVRYDLPYRELPASAGLDSGFLDDVLRLVVGRPGQERPTVLLVDALDEAEAPAGPELRAGVNRLKLPASLPDGVVVVASIREGVPAGLAATEIHLRHDDPRNAADVLLYTRGFLARRPEMEQRLREWESTGDAMTEVVARKCDGNFMYLVYLLEGIAAGTVRRTTHGDLEGLPPDLMDYYARHWRAMRDLGEGRFERVQRPVVCMLAISPGPVTAAKITEWISNSGLPQVTPREVKKVIAEWRPFLSELPGDPPRWRIYHSSFLEFLAERAEDVDLDEFREASLVATERKIRWDA